MERLGLVWPSIVVGSAYLVAGKLGLMLAVVHPSATAVWAPTGIALAAYLRLGYGVWPAIFVAVFLVNVTTAGSVATSLGIALGNTLEGVAEPFRAEAANGVERILASAEDVTERREADEALRRHQEVIRELSTPVLRIRDRLLILPVIGLIDAQRARHLTAELLSSIRINRARVVVIDMTGVATMTPLVAQQMLKTLDACRLLGATIIVTGLSHAIADTLVSIGLDLGQVSSLGDLQSGMEAAERLLRADGTSAATEAPPRRSL